MSTSTPTQSSPSPPPLASPAIYRMTVDEFERVADLLANDQVELMLKPRFEISRSTLLKSGVPSSLASRATAARAAFSRESPSATIDARAAWRTDAVALGSTSRAASRSRAESDFRPGRAISLAAARQAAITSSSLRDESASFMIGSASAEPRSPSPSGADGASGSPGVRASVSGLGAMSAWPSRARARTAAAFQARSLLVCQIRLSSGIAFGSPTAPTSQRNGVSSVSQGDAPGISARILQRPTPVHAFKSSSLLTPAPSCRVGNVRRQVKIGFFDPPSLRAPVATRSQRDHGRPRPSTDAKLHGGWGARTI